MARFRRSKTNQAFFADIPMNESHMKYKVQALTEDEEDEEMIIQ